MPVAVTGVNDVCGGLEYKCTMQRRHGQGDLTIPYSEADDLKAPEGLSTSGDGQDVLAGEAGWRSFVVRHHQVDFVVSSCEAIKPARGLVIQVTEAHQHRSRTAVVVDAGLDSHGGVNIARDPRGLDPVGHRVRLHHESTDESPSFARQCSREFERSRPGLAPSAGWLLDEQVIRHVRLAIRARMRSAAALLVRVSP